MLSTCGACHHAASLQPNGCDDDLRLAGQAVGAAPAPLLGILAIDAAVQLHAQRPAARRIVGGRHLDVVVEGQAAGAGGPQVALAGWRRRVAATGLQPGPGLVEGHAGGDQPFGFARRVLGRPGPPERLPARVARRRAAGWPPIASRRRARAQRRRSPRRGRGAGTTIPSWRSPVPAAADAGAAEPAYSDLPAGHAKRRRARLVPPSLASRPPAAPPRPGARRAPWVCGPPSSRRRGGVTLDARRAADSRPARPGGQPPSPSDSSPLALWRTTADERRRLLRTRVPRPPIVTRRWPPRLLAAAPLTVLSAVLGTHVAGGADSSGYLSQSRLWAAGRVTAAAPVLVDAPWPERGRFVAPLGYRPGGTSRRARPHLRAGAAVADGDRRRRRRRRRPLRLDADRRRAAGVGHVPARRRGGAAGGGAGRGAARRRQPAGALRVDADDERPAGRGVWAWVLVWLRSAGMARHAGRRRCWRRWRWSSGRTWSLAAGGDLDGGAGHRPRHRSRAR